MFFWFKKKVAVLDCFTTSQYVHDYHPVSKASKHLPSWFLNLPKTDLASLNPNDWFNMKQCVGFIDYFKESFTIPNWDNEIFRYIDGQININSTTKYEHHSASQYNNFLDETYHHVKMCSPWIIKSNTKTKFIQTFPIWCYDSNSALENIIHCPGIVDFYYQNATNVNLFLKKLDPKISKTGFFNSGTPLVFYTPLDDIKIKIKTHLVSKEEYSNIKQVYPRTPNRLLGSYFVAKKDRDRIDNQKKCPFGFK